MAFPQVQDADTKSGGETTNQTSHALTYPTNLASGDVILGVMVNDGGSSQSGWITESFTKISNQFGNNLDGWTVGETWYKFSNGTETGNFTITTGAAETSQWRIWRITGNHISSAPERNLDVDGTSTSPDPPSLNPSWGAADTLWIAVSLGSDGGDTFTVAPVSYTNLTSQAGGGSAGVSLGTARRENSIGVEDPGTFTVSPATSWSAVLCAIRPASGFTDAVISQGVGTDDIAVPLDVDSHDDGNTDHSDLWRSTSSPATGGSNIQNDITPVESDTIIDNAANSTVAPSPNTTYFYILRDWEDAGETSSHDSNEISILTAPARPTTLAIVLTQRTSIRIGWADQTGGLFKHLVFYRLKTDTSWILDTPTGVATGTDEHTVTELAEGVYEFHVRAWNDAQGLISGFDQVLEATTATELAAFQCDAFQYDTFQVREPWYVHPVDDVAIGNWTDELSGTTDIYGSIDEDPAVDSDYVTTLVVSTDDIYRFRLEPIGDRPCDQGFVLQYRIEKEGAGTVRMIFDIIKEDLTVVVTKTHANVADAIAEDKIELTSTQVATLKAANWFANPLVQVTADNGT